MRILGIESSCDETSASVVEDGRTIQSLIIASQTEIHAKYHGVVPEVASRAHVEQILPVVTEAIAAAGGGPPDGVAVSNRPGLSGALAVGVSFAKAYAWATELPFVAVDHMHAHAYAAFLSQEISYPFLVLLVSGGHTMLGVSHGPDELEVLGTTVDDACGEAYDKVSAFIGAGYPGGPVIDRLAAAGDARACAFPQARLNHAHSVYDMSFSGLKTAVVHQLDRFWNDAYPRTTENLAAAFQSAAVGQLVNRVKRAIEATGIRRIVAGGGVAANSELRRQLHALAGQDEVESGVEVVLPPPELCVDNGAMVAGLGYQLLTRGDRSPWDTGVFARVPEFRARR
ncbi:MAG: tRNA (adenosine(37)-N6)-threonylcarbamoyltransferase complex transferase subunit TsaD [Spirochaeta sp.]|jgi:N6-L-threonylcarbamoyladenine synthase|nr:tRNA (adenosine(37)-N6)-threonylcarbamoyltransferase complex transferase subunit TsaD [Spirochaeta sp.]